MAICNRTPDSFFDAGGYFPFDAFLRHVDAVAAQGADLVDIGGVKAGPGDEVGEAEEMDRVVPAIEAVVARLSLPVSVDTWRASVAEESFRAGAVVGNDISGFGDPDYLAVAAEAGATVVATHIRLQPRVPDPEPVYADLVGEVTQYLLGRSEMALAAGIPAQRVIVDAGLDLGKTPVQSLELLRRSSDLAGLGFPVLLSASNKTVLGALLDRGVTDRREASLAAAALGITKGCRLLRVHDVAGTVRVRNVIQAVLSSDSLQ